MTRPGARLRVLLAVVLAVATACGSQAGGKAVGGGWIDSSLAPTAKAQFGFSVQCLDRTCAAQKGSGTYDDKGTNLRFPSGVHLKLVTIIVGAGAGFTSGPTCANGSVTYDAADPKVPGSGLATVTICDNSRAAVKVPDTFSLTVVSGPYQGYADAGPVQGGQITITLPAVP